MGMTAQQLELNGIQILKGAKALFPNYVGEYEQVRLYAFEIWTNDTSDGRVNSGKMKNVYPDCMKLGQTFRGVHQRVKEEGYELCVRQKVKYASDKIWWPKSSKLDKLVIQFLGKMGVEFMRRDFADENKNGIYTTSEIGNFTIEQLKYAIACILNGTTAVKLNEKPRKFLTMHPHQVYGSNEAYRLLVEQDKPVILLHFVCRSGKSAMLIEICNRCGYTTVFLGTLRPADEESFLRTIRDTENFKDWQFISKYSSRKPLDQQYEEADKTRPILVFASLQDLKNLTKRQHQFLKDVQFDAVVWDECHFGCEGNLYKNFFDSKHTLLKTRKTIFMTGTPSKWYEGKVEPDGWITFDYVDEQRCKREWSTGKFSALDGVTVDPSTDNVYFEKPQMNFCTYEMPNFCKENVERSGAEFSLKAFFNANGKGKDAKFQFESQVAAYFNMLFADVNAMVNNGVALKEIGDLNAYYAMPYANSKLNSEIDGAMMYFDSVASVDAAENLLNNKKLFPRAGEFLIINCAGTKAGIGREAFLRVQDKIEKYGQNRRFIILSCGKLSECLTIPRVSAVFMLTDSRSVDHNEQCWNRGRDSIVEYDCDTGEKKVLKPNCFVFDFSPQRALQVNYARSQRVSNSRKNESTMQRLRNYIDVFPMHCFEGGKLKKLSAEDVMEKINAISKEYISRNYPSTRWILDSDANRSLIAENKALMKALAKVNTGYFLSPTKRSVLTITDTAGITKPRLEETAGKVNKSNRKSNEYEFIENSLARISSGLVNAVIIMNPIVYSAKDLFDFGDARIFEECTGISLKSFKKIYDLGQYQEKMMDVCIRMVQTSKLQKRNDTYSISMNVA